jgi:hypothetical protein
MFNGRHWIIKRRQIEEVEWGDKTTRIVKTCMEMGDNSASLIDCTGRCSGVSDCWEGKEGRRARIILGKSSATRQINLLKLM